MTRSQDSGNRPPEETGGPGGLVQDESPRSGFRAILRGYRRADLRADLRASLSTAAVDLPQAMAFAMLAGLSPAFGLYTAIVAGFVASLLGSSRHMVTSVNNAVCMMVATIFAALRHQGVEFDPAQAVVVLALLVGVLEIALALAGVANLSHFISQSVLEGFMLGTAFLIAANQVGNLLGLPEYQGANAVGELVYALGHLPQTSITALGVGLLAMVVMVVGPRLVRQVPGTLAAVAASAACVYLLGLGEADLPLVGHVSRKLPVFAWPVVDLRLLDALFLGALGATVLGAVEAVTIGNALASRGGYEIDNRRQLLAQGAANLASGLFHGLPCSASFTRSFLNQQVGARTQLAAAFSSLWILVVVLTAGNLVGYVPKAALAGVLMVLASRVPRWSMLRLVLRTTRSDAVALAVTFGATLVLRLDTALLVGVLVSVGLYLRKASMPRLVEYVMDSSQRFRQVDGAHSRPNPAVVLLHVEGDLFFGAAEVFEHEVRRVAKEPSVRVLVLRMKSARNLDATSVLALRRLAERIAGQGKHLLVSGVAGDVQRILQAGGVVELLGRENVFFSNEGILRSTGQALRRAQELLGEAQAEVRVFYDKPERIQELKGGGEKS